MSTIAFSAWSSGGRNAVPNAATSSAGTTAVAVRGLYSATTGASSSQPTGVSGTRATIAAIAAPGGESCTAHERSTSNGSIAPTLGESPIRSGAGAGTIVRPSPRTFT